MYLWPRTHLDMLCKGQVLFSMLLQSNISFIPDMPYTLYTSNMSHSIICALGNALVVYIYGIITWMFMIIKHDSTNYFAIDMLIGYKIQSNRMIIAMGEPTNLQMSLPVHYNNTSILLKWQILCWYKSLHVYGWPSEVLELIVMSGFPGCT